MPDGSIDPGSLEGDALTSWYLRVTRRNRGGTPSCGGEALPGLLLRTLGARSGSRVRTTNVLGRS
jgi:hypothetical protein